MSEIDQQAGSGVDPRELDEPVFDEEALRARRRQYGIAAASVAAAVALILAVPWRSHVEADGRIAPQRWARVHSEAPGVVREVSHKVGDTVQPGDVIAVLDFDEQNDALEAARLALAAERQKLADLDLRLRENSIQREGADAVAKFTGQRAQVGRIDSSRISAMDPVAAVALKGVRGFTTGVRAELTRNRSAVADSDFHGEELYQQVRTAMERYSERAASLADHLTRVGGAEAGRQFRFELEDLHFTYSLIDHSMEEILAKHELVERGLLAPVALRELCVELERGTMELAHGFRALSSSARNLLGSPAEHSERVRSAEETRRLLANEAERLEAQRSAVTSEIAAAELAVRAAERHHGKTAIRAPIGGTLAGDSLSRFDVVSANTAVGVVEDANHLVLKVRVEEADLHRIKVGQPVESRAANGGALKGSVVWTTPLAGQEVRDQAWNVLVQLEGDTAGVELGEKVMASIDVGRRSLLGRWFEPSHEAPAGLRMAFVEDPTELREAPGPRPLPGEVVQGQLASERPGAVGGVDGG